jgi:hypothetical protein
MRQPAVRQVKPLGPRSFNLMIHPSPRPRLSGLREPGYRSGGRRGQAQEASDVSEAVTRKVRVRTRKRICKTDHGETGGDGLDSEDASDMGLPR